MIIRITLLICWSISACGEQINAVWQCEYKSIYRIDGMSKHAVYSVQNGRNMYHQETVNPKFINILQNI